MENKSLSLFFKGIIWSCLAVIIFSPLYVSSKLFFPFITTKTFAFQIAVEVMVVAFLALCVIDKKYRIHTSSTVILLLVYLIILTIASAVSGNDFYHSFWSNNEREDGILLLGHLFLFSVVLTGFFRSVREWLYLLDMFLVAVFCVAVVSFDQYLALSLSDVWKDHFIPSSNGARLAATIGNAGYVGGYMVFGIFVSLFMALKRSKWWQKTWYVLLLSLCLFIAIQTQTRGAYLALALGVLISAVYLMWFYWRNKYLKIGLVVVLLVGTLGVVGIFTFKDSDFIKGQPILRRVASISLSEATANNRMVTWKIGWEGLKEKPLLGYGQENFYQVFDKYYTTKNSEQWFDRCHNMICDRAVTGGILGLIGYLALLLLPFYGLWKYYIKEYGKNQEGVENISRKYLTPIIFSILILAYIIQNMFIFEALAIYIPLIIVLSFVGLYGEHSDSEFWENENLKIGLLVAFVILFFPALYIFNLKPMNANADFITALSSQQTVDKRIDAFEEILSRDTYGNQEYRRHYLTVYENVVSEYMNDLANRTEAKDKLVMDFAAKMENQLSNQLKENPYSVNNYSALINFYNSSYFFDISRLQKALDVADKAIALSPNRPQVYYEIATTHYYLGNYLFSIKKEAEAGDQFVSAINTFYDGANKNYSQAEFLGQLTQFLLAVSKNASGEITAKAIMKIQPEKTIEMVGGLMMAYVGMADSENADKEVLVGYNGDLKQVINWLLKTNPQNKQLNDWLNELK
jgi:O-antigen ligase